MTELQKKAIAQVINNARHPTVTGGIFERKKMTTLISAKEAGRLLASEDYCKGWEACQLAMSESLRFVVAATSKELKHFVRG